MFLEKLEIQGFKSFATKNTLIFPGITGKDKRGITAVVGPNGSGKSNVADAVRWALGEQSMKSLRGKKGEDVIFSGSDKKGKLGMAEVSMHFNNEDRQAPIDFSQVVLTRRLYRSGESEYLLNNSRVRLADVQMLLAKASFGQKTYSVIGQGMVEGFLNTSLAERKEFFDEATGVKQYQIKRDDALNKLKSSYENLIQGEMLVQEIEPRIKSLTRQVAKLHKREELEKELEALKKDYYSVLWHELDKSFKAINEEYLKLDKEKIAKDKKLANFNNDLEDFKKNSFRENGFEKLQNELSMFQSKRNEYARELARVDAQIEMKLEAEGKFDLSFMHNKKEEIKVELARLDEEIGNLELGNKAEKNLIAEINQKKQVVDEKLREINKQMREAGRFIQEEAAPDVKKRLEMLSEKIAELRKEDDIEKIKQTIAVIEKELRDIISNGEKKETKELTPNEAWLNLHKELEKVSHEKDEVLSDLNDKQQAINSKNERIRLLREKVGGLKREESGIEAKIKQYSGLSDSNELGKEQARLNGLIEAQDNGIAEIKEKLLELNQQEEGKRQNLFAMQKEIQVLQNEINALSNQLQTLKISATRHETKLEDLEIEIRSEMGALSHVKGVEPLQDYDVSAAKEKIHHIKKQLEHIGGIDPAVEDEYNTTKERYDFLVNQTTDLKETISALEKVIKELDVLIKEKFDKEFKLIAKKFEEYFKILFNGGTARIDKVMEIETEEKKDEENKEVHNTTEYKKIKFLQKHNSTGLAGIEIKANPPGKRISSVAMLSGGERALTSIALICAIISSNPAPFVLLDEVDAALDEANSERLARILDELSHKTQFIVITHNRASMRKANILYGVTMGDDGVSKLLSVKLDDVKTK